VRLKFSLAPLLLPALIVALGLIGASPARAQVRVATVDELRRELSPGDVISVAQITTGSVKGRLLRFGDTDLDIRTETELPGRQQRRRLDVTVPLSAIQSLERPRDSCRNGALIGAGIGAGVSLAMFIHAAAVDYNEIDEWRSGYLAGAGILTGLGAVAGWAIDLAHSKPHIRFDARSTRSTEIRVTPLPVRGAGVALVVSF